MADTTVSTVQSTRRKLGRGLGSLLSAPVRIDLPPTISPPKQAMTPAGPSTAVATASQVATEVKPQIRVDEVGVMLIPLNHIQPNPHQPRQHFDEDALRALASSIKTSGLMQPIIVRLHVGGKQARELASTPVYQLIAGERRWRAAQIAGLERIPALVRDLDDKTAAEFALVENLQREDLNPLERAEAFQRLIDEFGLTHQEVAQRVGLERSSITNHLRLNELDDFSKDSLRAGRLSMGHAKVLLVIANKTERASLAGLAVREGWSVRELERKVKEAATRIASVGGGIASGLSSVGNGLGSGGARGGGTAHMADLEKRLREHLGTKVHLRPGRAKGSGRLVIEFYTLDQFEGLMKRMQFESE